ncbi:class I SAM-dependent methyltransferase [Alkalicoccobacillus murimartini]|uniref:SAM-dependent methyltransferase n=1 Tax=Alkalicoccobacillus murimartini TaxID=171685 RepID=A0ABT9YEA6_9BACI|nr:class I SAM-dependent methyltransferase [Alkalicoccobacillus murimartini]MDQ0206179.1 SAM-dependent methyltransferase [Alkalicoccobacillus murimartini]
MGERKLLKEYKRLWQARKWMKKNEPFLQAWHAHLGYSLDLFKTFQVPNTPQMIAERYGYRLDLLERWVEVGVALGHLKEKRGGKVQAKKSMVTYLSKDSDQNVGVLLKEMMELHIPTMLTYRNLLQGTEVKILEEDIGYTVAETSGLLESVMFPKIADVVKKQKVKSVLDVGCGHGGYLHRLHQKFPDIKVNGIESNKEVQKLALKEAKGTNISIIEADFMNYVDQDQYDLLMMNNLLYYFTFEDRLRLFKRARKLLQPKGHLLIMSPLARSKHGQRFASGFNSFMSAHEDMYPVPTQKELTSYAKQSGFSLVTCTPVIREGGWYILVFKKK